MSEGTGSPDIGPPKPPPSEAGGGTASSPRGPEARAASPLTDPSLASALERMASVDPRVARLMEDPPTEADAASPTEVVRLETPAGTVIDFDPEHPMTEDPGGVISRSREGLKTPKEPTGMLDPEYLRGIGPGHPDWASLTPEQQEMADRLRAAAAAGAGGPPPPDGGTLEGTEAPDELPPAPPTPDAPPRVEVERTLEYFDREILNATRQLGDWEERTQAYKTSADGRRHLSEIQRRITEMHQARMRRALTGVQNAERGMQVAEAEALRGTDGATQDEYKRILTMLRYKKSDRHREKEKAWSGRSVADLETERANLQSQLPELEAVLLDRERIAREAAVKAQITARGGSIEEAAEAQREAESAVQMVEEAERAKNRSERELRAVEYLWARLRIEDTGMDKLKNYVMAERAYKKAVSERRRSQEVGGEGRRKIYTNRDLIEEEDGEDVPSEHIFIADAGYSFAKAVEDSRSPDKSPSEVARAKAEVERYLKEANRRGYFDDASKEVREALAPFIERAWRSQQPLHLEPSELSSLLAIVARLKASAPTLILGMVQKKYDDGLTTEVPGESATTFAGVAELWVQRLEEYLRGYATDKHPENKFTGEFTLTHRGKGWHISEYGTPVVDRDLRTVEEFEDCMFSYVDFLIGGSVDRSPQNLFQKLQQFSEFFQGLASEKHPALAQKWRLQLKAMVGCYAADYFASLGNTPNMEAALTETFREADGIEVLPAAFEAMDGLVGLAVRTMNRKRRFRPLHRYSGDNGGLAFQTSTVAESGAQDLGTGSLEYIVRDNTEYLLAEELVVYDLSDAAYSGSALGARSSEQKNTNRGSVPNYQTSENLMRKYETNERATRIRLAVREGRPISEDDREYYEARMDRAIKAVQFARRIESALGERAKKASPSYVVEVLKRDREGRRLDAEGNVIVKKTVAVAETRGARAWRWMPWKWQSAPKKTVDSAAAVVERVDYLDTDGSIKYMQFADNLGRILAERENSDGRHLTADQIRARARDYRTQAKLELSQRGYGAKLLDHNGDEIYFQVRGETSGSDWQDGTRVDIDSAKTRGDYRVVTVRLLHGERFDRVKEKNKKKHLTDKEISKIVYEGLTKEQKAEVDLGIDVEIRREGYQSLDYDQVTNHVLANWNNQTYLGLQHEIRSQLLSQSVREQALKIRRGEILPEEADMLASFLLQIDPTLTRLRPVGGELGDSVNIKLINSLVAESSTRHFRIITELSEQFTDHEAGRIRSYYGVPNERFSWKELIYSADKLNREPERFGRRGYVLFKRSPVHVATFADQFGGDLSSAIGVVSRRDVFEKMYQKEITDSNVFAGWIGRINRAHEVLVRFAKGGKLGNEDVVPLGLKPFNDLDSIINTDLKAMFMTVGGHHHFLEAFRKCLGRLEATLKAIEAQDNVTGESGAMYVEASEIRYIKVVDGRRVEVFPKADDINTVFDYAEIRLYKGGGLEKNKKGEPVWQRLDRVVTTDVGAGANAAKDFLYSAFIPYAEEKGRKDYPHEAWAISYAREFEGWEYIDSKAINTGSGGR